jgi:hypothetical protein
VLTAVASDLHADLRPHLSAHGIELDACVISFEHGSRPPNVNWLALRASFPRHGSLNRMIESSNVRWQLSHRHPDGSAGRIVCSPQNGQ